MDNQNIFQIWDSNGRKTPFAVRKTTWAEHNYVVIERVDCEKMPYGKAYGYPMSSGRRNDWFNDDYKWLKDKLIRNSGVYYWVLVENLIL